MRAHTSLQHTIFSSDIQHVAIEPWIMNLLPPQNEQLYVKWGGKPGMSCQAYSSSSKVHLRTFLLCPFEADDILVLQRRDSFL